MGQRKITEPPQEDIEAESQAEAPGPELPDLTPQQSEFVRAILEGKKASDAYRAAYSTENMQPGTIWAAASRLRHNTKVSAWIDVAKRAGLGKAESTFEEHLRELERLKALCINAGNYGAAVQAEQLRGKAQGYYTERVAVVDDDNPVELIERMARMQPDLAVALAKEYNIPWTPQTKH